MAKRLSNIEFKSFGPREDSVYTDVLFPDEIAATEGVIHCHTNNKHDFSVYYSPLYDKESTRKDLAALADAKVAAKEDIVEEEPVSRFDGLSKKQIETWLLEQYHYGNFSSYTVQKRPNTCFEIEIWTDDDHRYTGKGFSKANWPDKWNCGEGIRIAVNKAIRDIAEQILSEQENRNDN